MTVSASERDAAGLQPSAMQAVGSCAEALLVLLVEHGVRVLFLNPGTDSAPIQEAFASLVRRGQAVPRCILCRDERVALAAAHGYWQVEGELAAVFVHVDIGTQSMGAMVHNVYRDHAGVVVIAGRAPYSEARDSPGARSHAIHWQQDVPDQAGIVRSYAAWAFELTRVEDAARVIGRAVQVAATTPGLAYVMVSRDVLMEAVPDGAAFRTRGYAVPAPGGVAPAVAAECAGYLRDAKRPLMIVGRVARLAGGPEAIAGLAHVAEMPVISTGNSISLPSDDPLHVRLRHEQERLVRTADTILLVASDVPWVPRSVEPATGCVVLQLDADPVKREMPLWSFPVDLAIKADPVVGLQQLRRELEREGRSAPDLSWWPASRDPERSGPRPGIATHHDSRSVSIDTVVTTLNVTAPAECLIVEEAVSNSSRFYELLERASAATVFSSGGPGLGWALGGAVGIKLCRPEAPVLAVVGDGALMFANPVAGFCLMNELRMGILVLVLNNHAYRASRLPVLDLYPAGVSAQAGVVVGSEGPETFDIARIAVACGLDGVAVDTADALTDALRHGFEQAAVGKSFVVDVRIAE